MRLAPLLAIAIGLLAAAGWTAMAMADADVMPSYLAAWLFWMAVPFGALPLVMGLEALGRSEWPALLTLRRACLLLPVGAVLALPVLFSTAVLFRRPDIDSPLPAAWMAPGFFIARAVVILAVLSVLAVLFSRTPAVPRRGLAMAGLAMHVCLVSLAAVDWVLALQPGIGSSAFGVLLMASQIGIAASLAAFLLAVNTPAAGSLSGLGVLLAVLLASWAFLHFMQFLVIWSANLPHEVVWYTARTPGLGSFTVWFGVAACVLTLALLPTALAKAPAVLATVAAMLLTLHLAETLWLVTPAFRGSFVVTLPDALAVFGLGGLLVGLLLLVLPRQGGSRREAA